MGNRDQAYEGELLDKLRPETVRANLIRAGLFLAGWEMLKGEVQTKVQQFFIVGFDSDGYKYSHDYERRVLSRHKSRFEASLIWLVEASAINEEQAAQIRELREYRNTVAHELPKILLEPGHCIDVARIRGMRELIADLGHFWGRIEIEIDPSFVSGEIADDDIRSMLSVFMDHIVGVVESEQP